MRLRDVKFSENGEMTYPHHEDRAPVSVLPEYLAIAEKLASQRQAPDLSDASIALGSDFEALRWFDLPAACLKETSK